jgi:hypothetical protein
MRLREQIQEVLRRESVAQLSSTHCHPERSICFAKRSRCGVEGSLQPFVPRRTQDEIYMATS